METTVAAVPATIDLSNVRYRIGKADIKKGCRCKSDNCPNTLAVLRWLAKHYPGTDFVAETDRANVRVMQVKSWYKNPDGSIYRTRGGRRIASEHSAIWYARSPASLRSWVDELDGGATVGPLEVNLGFSLVATYDEAFYREAQ